MSEMNDKIVAALKDGYHCSQIMMQLSMELRDMDEPFTIRALGALGGGIYAQRACGTLTGGACVIASYFKREDGEREPREYQAIIKEFVEWFEKEHGGTECRELVEYVRPKILEFCPGLMERTFVKIVEILKDNGIDPAE